MSQENKEFYDLLNELVNEQMFDLELTNGTVVKCKQLTTAQLKELIRAVVDSPLTQTNFNTAATTIFKQSVNIPVDYTPNVIDRLLFLIETRIHSISPILELTNNDGIRVSINLTDVKTNILNSVRQNISRFEKQTVNENKFELTLETPALFVEEQLNKEIYNNFEPETTTQEGLRNAVADMFVHELAKYISSLTLNGTQTIYFNETTFSERLDVLQKLPAFLIQKIVEYIENQKTLVEQHLLVDGMYVAVDSSFFTLR